MKRVKLLPSAFALRPVRALVAKNEFVFYEGTTFPRNPRSGCELYLRRCLALGFLNDEDSGLVLDVLDTNGDVIQDFPLTRRGFEYLRRSLKFRKAGE